MPKSGGKPVFIHISNFSREYKRPIAGLSVSYVKTTDSKGRSCAINAVPLRAEKVVGINKGKLLFSIIISCVFFTILGTLVVIHRLPIVILYAYLILSIVAYIMYKKDKSAAEWDEWRTPENTLHFISIIGGWPGALIAQNILRHKSRKLSFQWVYWATVMINWIALAWLFTPNGAKKLKVFMNLIHLG